MRPATFVVLSTTDWDAPQFGSRQQIALRLARRGHRVLYVEVARSLHSLISDRPAALRSLRGQRQRTIADGLDLLTPPPVLPHLWAPGVLAINQRLLVRAARRGLERRGWRADVLWTYWANTAAVLGRLGERAAVYHCVEDFPAIGYPWTPRRRIERLEQAQCRRANLVLVRNVEIAARHRQVNPATHFVPGGVDLELFDPDRHVGLADDVTALPAPRVGLVGTLDDRVDVELVAACARALPEVSFALVGPVKSHRVDLRPLDGLRNVHRLPARSHAQVPAAIAALDVGLVPYRRDESTRLLAPLKLYEMLAMGKPVVAIDLPYLRREAAHIRLAHDTESFVAELSAELLAPPDGAAIARRRQAAAAMGWDAQVDRIEALLEPLLGGDP